MYRQILRLTILLLFLLSSLSLFPSDGIWNVRSFGAKGDGKTLDTHAIQSAIDGCFNSGGGKVLLEGGQFLSGSIQLRSNVTLFIETGAILLGSDNPDDYPVILTNYPTVSGEFEVDKALIYAENAQNIMISGSGSIDGRGDLLHHTGKPRPHIITIRSCNNIKIRDIKLYNAAFWVQKYQSCYDLLIDGITVDSRENKDIEQPRFIDVPGGRNTDGCNVVDCSNVRISNCNINSGDDGIVFKSFLREQGCRNVVVSNCIITTNASGIKIGTESAGAFRDFTINNCVIYDTRGAAIGLMTVDGAAIEQILISDITLRNIKGTAIFLRLGNRGRIYQEGYEKPKPGAMRDILIQNVYGNNIERYGCSITGIPGAYPENITLSNIRLKFRKGTSPLLFEGYENRILKDELTVYNVPENEGVYPRGEMFGKLPAYGFYVRHVKNIEFDGIQLERNEYDVRPVFVSDDVDGLMINRFVADLSIEAPGLFQLRDTKHACITNSGSAGSISVFLNVLGTGSKNIILRDNNWNNVKHKYVVEEPGLKKEISIKF